LADTDRQLMKLRVHKPEPNVSKCPTLMTSLVCELTTTMLSPRPASLSPAAITLSTMSTHSLMWHSLQQTPAWSHHEITPIPTSLHRLYIRLHPVSLLSPPIPAELPFHPNVSPQRFVSIPTCTVIDKI